MAKNPYEELRERAAGLTREEKIAAFQAYKSGRPMVLPEILHKPTTDEAIDKGLDRIRMARRARVGLWVAILVVSIGVSKYDVPISAHAYGIAALILVMVMEGVLLMLPCPRCGFRFISRPGKSFTRACCSCGLSLDKGLQPFFW